MDVGDLSSAVPGAGAGVEGSGAAWGGVAGSAAAGEGAAAPVFSVETAVCEGLRPPWAKPEVTATPANAIPKTQPSDVRVFIYPHELLMVLNCRASAHNIRRPALPLYSAQRRSTVTDLNLSHADRHGQEWSHSAGRDGRSSVASVNVISPYVQGEHKGCTREQLASSSQPSSEWRARGAFPHAVLAPRRRVMANGKIADQQWERGGVTLAGLVA